MPRWEQELARLTGTETTRSNAQKGYETVLAWIGLVRDGDDSDRLGAKLGRLKERLERYSP